LLLLAGAVAPGCGCGDNATVAGTDGGIDAAQDAGRPDGAPHQDRLVQEDRPCSLPLRAPGYPPPVSLMPIVAYDKLILAKEPGAPNGLMAAFLDTQGVAVFAYSRFARTTLTGDLLQTHPYSPGSYPAPVRPYTLAQGAVGYGASAGVYLGADLGGKQFFCVFDLEGNTDPDACPELPLDALVWWDGTAYWAQGYTSVGYTTMFLRSYDASGTLVTESTAPPDESIYFPVYVGDNAVSVNTRPHETGCTSFFLQVLPRSLDMSQARRWDLLPPDFACFGPPMTAASGARAAILVEGLCVTPAGQENPCRGVDTNGDRPAALLTIVGSDGEPLVLSRHVPYGGVSQLLWDGEAFLGVVNAHEPIPGQDAKDSLWLYRFSQDGEHLGHAKVELLVSYHHVLGQATVLAVGPLDYIAVYHMLDTDELYIARFTLVPA
jgi:hypothetical protein